MFTMTRECRVDRLKPGVIVTGTAASGDFEDGARTLVSRTLAPEHAKRMTAWRCEWVGGSFNVYYGDTMVQIP